ncbi:MAG: 30S ribosomal protein S16 [Patescibacteria group bacterium]|jgi:small subunit ribosomal protein S16
MVKIRLARSGVKKNPFYRIVAIDTKRKRGGKPLEILGSWHPSKDSIEIDKKKVNEWVKKGAQVSKAVEELLNKK